MMEWIKQPWPWYVAGPLIGLTVPALLILGNKSLGISASLRHVCAACFPGNISFFRYEWKKEAWNLFFVGGILVGAILVTFLFPTTETPELNPKLVAELQSYGITEQNSLMPEQLFNWKNLFSAQGFFFIVFGGFLVGFGTRYAGGCTSGHSIMGLSNLQWPSLVATICFMAGGFVVSNLIIPLLLKW